MDAVRKSGHDPRFAVREDNDAEATPRMPALKCWFNHPDKCPASARESRAWRLFQAASPHNLTQFPNKLLASFIGFLCGFCICSPRPRNYLP